MNILKINQKALFYPQKIAKGTQAERLLKATASSVIEPIRLDVLGGNIRSIYWGKASGNPAFSAVLAIGHFYLNTSNGNIYSYNGITWELNNATDLEMQCMTDLLEIAQSSSSIGTPTFINKLVAYTAFINKLLSKEVTIDASTFGFIKSSNFATTDDDWIKSTPIPTAGFGIYAGENGVSSIGAVILMVRFAPPNVQPRLTILCVGAHIVTSFSVTFVK